MTGNGRLDGAVESRTGNHPRRGSRGPDLEPGQSALSPRGYTKLDLARYYLAVAEGALRAAGGRPNVLVRYPNGIEGEFFYQKRAPESRPPWIEVVSLRFPSGRSADEVVPRDAAALIWMANLACLELHPHPVRAEDLDHPDELRVDLDPVPGVDWPQIREVARRGPGHARTTSGWSAGRRRPARAASTSTCASSVDWTFTEVRRAALAFAREVERRAPAMATSKWWKEERHGVFLDYNQNAKDRTIAAAYSVRPTADARVSAPLTWDEIDDVRSRATSRSRRCRRGSRPVGDRARGHGRARRARWTALLELAARHEKEGLGDAPWPPHYQKQAGEPARVQPSRRRTPKFPLIEIGRAAERRTRSPASSAGGRAIPRRPRTCEPADMLVDAMRGRFHTWTRVRINLQHVPEALRPPQEALDPDDGAVSRRGNSRRKKSFPFSLHRSPLTCRRSYHLP